jgi:uncharacterized membrane protein YgaE (UPF0421/DUF939 family)
VRSPLRKSYAPAAVAAVLSIHEDEARSGQRNFNRVNGKRLGLRDAVTALHPMDGGPFHTGRGRQLGRTPFQQGSTRPNL